MKVDYVASNQTNPQSARFRRRRGLTLVEIMIALTMTLIVLGAMMTAFQYASAEMQSGRALMELANRARTAESLLRSDLANLTLDTRPYAQTTNPPGFFEYVEGPSRDATASLTNSWDSYFGDIDDALGMTVRSSARPFRGRLVDSSGNTAIIESSLAEVWWFTTWTDNDGNIQSVNFDESARLHRRVLLIRPETTGGGLPTGQILNEALIGDVNSFFQNNDISARVVPGDDAMHFDVFANDLTDLANRKHRFCHRTDLFGGHQFPNRLDRDFLVLRQAFDSALGPGVENSGTEILLTDVAGFDLQAYSPNSRVNLVSDIVVEPSDIGYVNNNDPVTNPNLGAFVDLGHNALDTTDASWFAQNASPRSGCAYVTTLTNSTGTPINLGPENVYDTWTPFYESDGLDQDLDTFIDEGTNGLDDDNINGVDDTVERETLPPYPYPLRGLKVTIRLVEKDSKQVHQNSIIHSFVPE